MGDPNGAAAQLLVQAGAVAGAKGGDGATQQALLTLQELAACRALRRSRLLSSLTAQSLSPLHLVCLASAAAGGGCGGSPLDSLWVLQHLVPEPSQAAGTIQHAAASQPVVHALLQLPPHRQPPAAAGAVLGLLQALLGAACDAAVLAADGQLAGTTITTATGTTTNRSPQLPVHAYAQQTVTHLERAAAGAHATSSVPLAVCLFMAADACAALHDKDVVCAWVQRLLHTHMRACLHPAGGGGAAHTALSSWASVALQPHHWRLSVPCILPHVLKLVQDTLVEAASSAQGLAEMCALLMALAAHDSRQHTALTPLQHTLAAAVARGCCRSILAPLLVAGQLVASGGASCASYAHMLQRAVETALAQDGTQHGAPALPALLKCFSLLMLGSEAGVLHEQVQLLHRLKSGVRPVLHAELARTAATLADVLAQKQQQANMQQAGAQTSNRTLTSEAASYQAALDQFLQQVPDASGSRQLTQIVLARWRLWAARGAAQSFADMHTLMPPETPARAAAALQYISELERHGLCKQLSVQAFQAACAAVGLDVAGHARRAAAAAAGGGVGAPAAAAAAAAEPASATARLKLLLGRLPSIVSSSCTGLESSASQGLAALLDRIRGQASNILQQQQQPPGPEQLLDLLLSAYDSAAAGAPSLADGGGLAWRLVFVNMLQRLQPLHAALLQRLQACLHGSGCLPHEALAQALRAGSLAALLGTSQLVQVQCLSAASADSPITSAPAAVGMFSWHAVPTASAAAAPQPPQAGAPSPGAGPSDSLRGVQLVQHLLGQTATATLQQRCCAASFWAAYLGCLRRACTRWCAGQHGPFGDAAPPHLSTSPASTSAATTSTPLVVGALAELSRTAALVGYVPPQLASLLDELACGLAEDAQRCEMAAGALQACMRACRVQVLRWAAAA